MNNGVALVTGAGRRIGRAIALGLGEAGLAVAVHYNRSAAEAEAVAAAIAGGGGRACAVQADLADEAATRAMAGQAAEALGPLTALVNNASLFERDSATTASAESWYAHMAVNARAPFVLTQAVAAQLPPATDGTVINILDQRVWNLTPHFVSYTVSKSALWTLTRTLALALAPRVRVNAIGPGPTLPSARQTQAQFDGQVRATPLGRATGPEEIVNAVRFIMESPNMTGQMIALDGGQHLGWAQAASAPEE